MLSSKDSRPSSSLERSYVHTEQVKTFSPPQRRNNDLLIYKKGGRYYTTVYPDTNSETKTPEYTNNSQELLGVVLNKPCHHMHILGFVPS